MSCLPIVVVWSLFLLFFLQTRIESRDYILMRDVRLFLSVGDPLSTQRHRGILWAATGAKKTTTDIRDCRNINQSPEKYQSQK